MFVFADICSTFLNAVPGLEVIAGLDSYGNGFEFPGLRMWIRRA